MGKELVGGGGGRLPVFPSQLCLVLSVLFCCLAVFPSQLCLVLSVLLSCCLPVTVVSECSECFVLCFVVLLSSHHSFVLFWVFCCLDVFPSQLFSCSECFVLLSCSLPVAARPAPAPSRAACRRPAPHRPPQVTPQVRAGQLGWQVVF